MTSKEAIDILRNAAWLGSNEDRDKMEEAVEMAISALEIQTNAEEVTSPLLTERWKSKHRRIEP